MRSKFLSVILLVSILAVLFSCSDDATSSTQSNFETAPDVNELGIVLGTVQVNSKDNVRIHSFVGTDVSVLGFTSHIVETESNLVILDVMRNEAVATELKLYAEAIDKPIERIILSHGHPDHFGGAVAFPNAIFYALAEVKTSIESSPFALPDLSISTMEQGIFTLDGIEMDLSLVADHEADFTTLINFVGNDIVFANDLISNNVHHFLAQNQIANWITIIEGLKTTHENSLVLCGHGGAAQGSIIQTNIEYLQYALTAIEEANGLTDFKNKLKAQYPDWTVPGIFNFSSMLFYRANIFSTLPNLENLGIEGAVEVASFDNIRVHSYVANVTAGNSGHIIESKNKLVILDVTNSNDFSAEMKLYTDALGKDIDRVIISHSHPDHIGGAETFADIDFYALAEVITSLGGAISGIQEIPAGITIIDEVTFDLSLVVDSEADYNTIINFTGNNTVFVNDVVYDKIHLFLGNNNVENWIEALNNLILNYPENKFLSGHDGLAEFSMANDNIVYLQFVLTALETATDLDDFRQKLLDQYPEWAVPGVFNFSSQAFWNANQG